MSKITTIINYGLEHHLIRVECMFSNGLPNTTIVGMAGRMVTESRDRLRGAFQASRLKYPRRRIICNLVPASLPKTDTSLDLALAVAILQADNQLPLTITSEMAFIGELGLDGSLQSDKYIVAKLLAAKAAGINQFFIPALNVTVAAIVPGVALYPVQSLKELVDYAHQLQDLRPIITGKGICHVPKNNTDDPFQGIIGLSAIKRGLLIAAAGKHNLLLQGPPGAGKSLLAASLCNLLPAPDKSEVIAINQTTNFEQPSVERPVVRPHHSTTISQFIGTINNPGSLIKAHCGVLLLDELAEFSRATLEALRQPLENHSLNFKNLVVPTDFILMATTNPCPCGYSGSATTCTCQSHQLKRYQNKLSGALLDRIDLHICFNSYEQQSLLSSSQRKNIDLDYIGLVQRVIDRQRTRQKGTPNGRLSALQLRKHLRADQTALELLSQAADKFKLSHRSYLKVAAVSRTIADLDDQDEVSANHIAEALQYRPTRSQP